MVAIPEDIKKGIEKLSKSTGIELKALVEEFKQILKTDPTIQTMEKPEFKIRYGYALLLKRYVSAGTVTQLYLKPLSKPRVRMVTSQGKTKAVANLYALVRRITRDEAGNVVTGDIEYAAGTLWENAASACKALQPNKVYKTALRVTEVNGGLELGGNDASFIEVNNVEFPSNEDYYKQYIEPRERDLLVRLADLDLNNRENLVDIRVIKAMVIDVGVGETASHVEFGRYTVVDDSLLVREESGPSSYSIWVHPDDVIWDVGSTLKFVGTVSYDAAANIARFDCHFIVPTDLAIKRKIEPKPITQPEMETIDVDSLEEELDKEHQKIEESLEIDL